MITKAYFSEIPDIINYMPLPKIGKADVWLRKNITKITDSETNEVSYSADEAYMRTNVSEDKILANFDGWFETASKWQTSSDTNNDTADERIAAIITELESIKTENAALAEELQAAKIILGVE